MTTRIELAYKLLYAGLSATVPDKIGKKFFYQIAIEVSCISVMIDNNKQIQRRKFINTRRL